MKRLYYLTRDLSAVRSVAEDLHQAGITHWHFHVLSKDKQGLYRHHIHSATPLQRLDIVHSAEQGALLGGGFGLVLATILWLFDPPGFPMDLKLFTLIVLICCLLGIWIGSLGGLSRENYKITRFHDAIDNGQHLILVDIRKKQEARVKQLIADRHPLAVPAGEGSTLNNPFRDSDPQASS